MAFCSAYKSNISHLNLWIKAIQQLSYDSSLRDNVKELSQQCLSGTSEKSS